MPADLLLPLRSTAPIPLDAVGPKAATLATLDRAGLRVPEGTCVTATAYRAVLEGAGVAETARRVAGADPGPARRLALEVRLAMLRAPLGPPVTAALDALARRLGVGRGTLVAVRSSALLEDSPAVSFAGQFETFLGIGTIEDLATAVRGCWASLWSTRALRYMRDHEVDPATTAMAVLVQPMIPASAAGGALSETAEGNVLVTGTWGLGSAVAQGEVVPDRWVFARNGSLRQVEPGRKDRLVACADTSGPFPRAVAAELVAAPCLAEADAAALVRIVLQAEEVLARPVEIEWAKDERDFSVLQARPLRVAPRHAGDEVWLCHPGLRGHPAGVGWGSGPACVVLDEHDLARVALGDVLVTQVAGPALTAVLPRVAGVVAELGGSTSHLAALARERGIPAVLGVLEATRRIPEGSMVAVDGVAGVVRWIA